MRSASEPYAQLIARRGAREARRDLGTFGNRRERADRQPLWRSRRATPASPVSGPVEAVITRCETGSAEREANMRLFARRALALLEDCVRKT